jgi:hypothetical protein
MKMNQHGRFLQEWRSVPQGPESPSDNTTSRNCELAPA